MLGPMNEVQRQGTQQPQTERNARGGERWRSLGVVLALLLAGVGFVLPEDVNAPSTHLLHSSSADSSDCPAGGTRLATGFDTNGNGALDASEELDHAVVCDGLQGTNGASGPAGDEPAATLLSTTTIAAGSTCANGGALLSWGHDDDGNGMLEAEETLGSETICHGTAGLDGAPGAFGPTGDSGADGADGAKGMTSLIEPRTVPLHLCSAGLVLVMGLDDGAGAGTVDDGVLHDDEVDHAMRLCDGPLSEGRITDLNSGLSNSFTAGCDAMTFGDDGTDVWAAMSDGATGCELYLIEDGWRSPVRVLDLNPAGDAEPGRMLGLTWDSAAARLLFDAVGEQGQRDLWAYDPVSGQPARLTSAPGQDTVDLTSRMTDWNGGKVLSRPSGAGLPWWTDGSVDGTHLLDEQPSLSEGEALGMWAQGMLRFGRDVLLGEGTDLWMEVEDATGEVELLRIDANGTPTVHDLHPGTSSSPSSGVAVHGGVAVAATTLEGRQIVHVTADAGPRTVTSLVRSNGQPTEVLADAFGAVAVNEMLLFDAVVDGADASLWRWDPATDEVLQLSSSILAPGLDAAPVTTAEAVWFSCVTMGTGAEVCSTDGSVLGTRVHELRPGWQGSAPTHLAPLGQGIAVLANNGSGAALHHLTDEGWVSLLDPWTEGDAEAGRYGNLLVGEEQVVFVAHDGSTGHELHAWAHGALTGTWTVWA